MEGNDGQNQERFEVTKKCSVLPAEIIYRNEDVTKNTPKVPGQQDVSKGSPRGRTDSICNICHVTLCDERNLYIHKFLKHGEKNTLVISNLHNKRLMLFVQTDSHVQSTSYRPRT